MLNFDKSDIAFFVTITLTELTQAMNPLYYLFIFTHIETKYEIKKVFNSEDDLSNHKYRYNKFMVTNAAEYFNRAPVGHYTYKVYQQSNPDPDSYLGGANMVEEGRMILSDYQNRFQLTEYDTQTDYKAYNG